MEIKILGIGCPNCERLEQRTREAVAEAGVEAEIVKVTHMGKIMEYPIVSTPGLVINEQVLSSGRIPRKEEIVAWLKPDAGGSGACSGCCARADSSCDSDCAPPQG